MQTDKKLGEEISLMLQKKGIETPMHKDSGGLRSQDYIAAQVGSILQGLGLDLEDDSLKDTPRRVAKMYTREIFSGLSYENFPKATTIDNKMAYDEIVCVRNIVVRSCCEHHLQPIYGKIHIAYIPNKKVLGLSKFARIADFFASRPQVQERLTEQVYASLSYILETEDIAVMVEGEHFCMKMRGVEDHCSDTTTSKMGGRFRTDANARTEVLAIMTNKKA